MIACIQALVLLYVLLYFAGWALGAFVTFIWRRRP